MKVFLQINKCQQKKQQQQQQQNKKGWGGLHF